jgi:hypothetical protein
VIESAWFQPLSLSSEKLVSKFAFKCNLYRYSVAAMMMVQQPGMQMATVATH